MQAVRLGELLLRKGLIKPSDVESALSAQASLGGLFGQVLVRMGALSEADLLTALSEQLSLPVQTRDDLPTPAQIRSFLEEAGTPLEWWVERQAVAWRKPESAAGSVVCAAAHPLDPALQTLAHRVAGGAVEMRLASRALVGAALADLAGGPGAAIGSGASEAKRLRELAEEAPAIDFVNAIFAEALQSRASDVHIEPFEDRFTVRMRVDGMLHTVRSAPRAAFDAVCSRLKLLSGMDIGERRLPQDGRQAIRIAGQDIDLRVSTLPAAWGESVVMRLLGRSHDIPQLTELGLSAEEAGQLTRLAAQPNGIVLVTGPTGSGKTTTIYRLLSELNDGVRKIITVEDPIEFNLPGVVQVGARSDIGLTFAAGLRSILRQDPDVIMVGEIRDPETARIAVQAALTGHLVISTVHTNSAFAAVARLLDLGAEDYLLADVLRGVVGQRLIRRLCPTCSRPDPAPPVGLGSDGERWRVAVGCQECSGTGYRGRLGLFELATMSPRLAGLVRARAGEEALIAAARSEGHRSLLDDGLLKAGAGRTTVVEVMRALGDIDPARFASPQPALQA